MRSRHKGPRSVDTVYVSLRRCIRRQSGNIVNFVVYQQPQWKKYVILSVRVISTYTHEHCVYTECGKILKWYWNTFPTSLWVINWMIVLLRSFESANKIWKFMKFSKKNETVLHFLHRELLYFPYENFTQLYVPRNFVTQYRLISVFNKMLIRVGFGDLVYGGQREEDEISLSLHIGWKKGISCRADKRRGWMYPRIWKCIKFYVFA